MTETAHLTLSPLEHFSAYVNKTLQLSALKSLYSSLSIDRHRHDSMSMLLKCIVFVTGNLTVPYMHECMLMRKYTYVHINYA